MKVQRTLLMIGVAVVAVVSVVDAPDAEERGALLTPGVPEDIARLEAAIDRIEAQTVERLAAPPDNQVQRIELLG